MAYIEPIIKPIRLMVYNNCGHESALCPFWSCYGHGQGCKGLVKVGTIERGTAVLNFVIAPKYGLLLILATVGTRNHNPLVGGSNPSRATITLWYILERRYTDYTEDMVYSL